MAEVGIPVAVVGLGEVGRAIARAAAASPLLRLVAAADPAAGIAGRPLDRLLGAPAGGLTVLGDAGQAIAAARGGVVLLATTSAFERALPLVERAVRGGCSVVTTCEELAYPWLDHEAEAEALDALCEANGVAVVGTGVNPGFALDRLPAFLAQVVGEVRHVHAVRVVDLAKRRDALRRKVGCGLDEAAFRAADERGELGHAGLSQSAALAAAGCGIEVDEVEEELSPLLAEEAGEGLRPGQVAGVHQEARAFAEGREVVRLELVLALGAERPRDELELDADPPLRLVVPGGIPGEAATVHAVLHAALAVGERHGLLTVLDLPAGR